jgi:hypothetical protein
MYTSDTTLPSSEINSNYNVQDIIERRIDNTWYKGTLVHIDKSTVDVYFEDTKKTEHGVPKEEVRLVPKTTRVSLGSSTCNDSTRSTPIGWSSKLQTTSPAAISRSTTPSWLLESQNGLARAEALQRATQREIETSRRTVARASATEAVHDANKERNIRTLEAARASLFCKDGEKKEEENEFRSSSSSSSSRSITAITAATPTTGFQLFTCIRVYT